MKVLIFGASGMIGRGVLLECLDHDSIEEVFCIVRRPTNESHPKYREIVHSDFKDYSEIADKLKGFDACYFCLGVSAAGLSEEKYTEITYRYTLEAAKTLYSLNPDMTFTYVSGVGTDSSEKGRQMWARVKGKTENDLMSLGFKKAIMFRPGLIFPKRGIESRTALYRFFYRYFMWLFRLIALISPNSTTNTIKIGKAMINAPEHGIDQSILDPHGINKLSEQS